MVPDELVGTVMGDLSSRRGHVLGSEPAGDDRTVVKAEVPQIEMTRYAIDLRASSHGAATFTRQFKRYEPMPENVAARMTGLRMGLGLRLVLATLLEAGWEIVENTDFVINRYREATIALDYYGDSVVNAAVDILAMVAGFVIAARLPIRATALVAVTIEVVLAWSIRDNLTLNVIMLLWPLESIKAWQGGA